MDIACENLGGREILVGEINEFAQIYRFDDFRLQLRKGNYFVVFDVPSTEWLERLTAVIKVGPVNRYHETLRASGYKFIVSLDNDAVDMEVYDISTSSVVNMTMSYQDVSELHEAFFDCIARPYLDQGGSLQQLKDLSLFQI
ncbi:MAG: hypothetical protein M0P95_18340 [Sulfuritalea sp.]|jgi:hypothetical protein|nr:hypothetical protein [Sulfuritalea sp.]